MYQDDENIEQAKACYAWAIASYLYKRNRENEAIELIRNSSLEELQEMAQARRIPLAPHLSKEIQQLLNGVEETSVRNVPIGADDDWGEEEERCTPISNRNWTEARDGELIEDEEDIEDM